MSRKEALVSTRVLINKSKGFALVEVLLTLGISMLLVVGLVALGLFSLKSSVAARVNAEAGKTAQAELERLKLLRDAQAEWATFVQAVDGCADSAASETDGCHIQVLAGGTFAVQPGPGEAETFTNYKLNYSFGATNLTGGNLTATDTTALITQRTWWKIGDRPRSYIVQTILSDWRDR